MGLPTVEKEDFYSDLDLILDEINIKCVKMDDVMKKQYVRITSEVIKTIINSLKSTDEVFEKLYSKLEYVGSYFDGLRVTPATEFDLNLIMKLPYNYNQIIIENQNVSAGFVKINISKATINSNQPSEKVIKTIQKWCDNDGYLLENRVRQWMEGIISRCLGHGTQTLTISSGENVKVKVRKSGPAYTLNLDTGTGVIDVDLVFTIQFPETKQPPSPIRWNSDLAACWVVVPKPSNDPCFWRVSFTYSERRIIQNKYKLKLINRLLKALRDARDWQIPSYYIKTLFLWEVHECTASNRTRFWEKKQGYLFVYMLNQLFIKLNENKLLYYWHKKMNLLDNKFNSAYIISMANNISRIISKINDLILKKDKKRLREYILTLFQISEELAVADLSLADVTEKNEENTSCSIS